MSQPPGGPVHYTVVYSQRVKTELLALVQRAIAKGLGLHCLAAVQEIDRRLHVYPQFGEPTIDLQSGDTVWVGTVSPLVIHYVIDERRRLVYVVKPLQALPLSGL